MGKAMSVWPVCCALIFCVTAFSASQGLTYPLLALIMERGGESTSAIAMNAAMTPLGIIISAPLINRYAARAPRGPAIASAIGGTIAVLLLIGLTTDPDIWLVLRFLLGCSVNAVYVLSEASLLAIAPASHRGRLMGAYTSITTTGYAIGPLILLIAGTGDITPFLMASLTLFLAMLPFFFVKVVISGPAMEHDARASIPVFLRSGGLLVAAYAATTLFDNGFMTLFPSFGFGFGLSEQGMSVMLFSLFLGGAVFQMPIGWAIDRSSVFLMLVACTFIGSLGFVVIGLFLPNMILAIALAFFWGGAVLGIQTVALVEMGRRYTGSMLLAGNASLALMWGVSGIAGVPLTGYGMDVFGPNGLLIVVGGLFAITSFAFTIEVLLRGGRPSSAMRESGREQKSRIP